MERTAQPEPTIEHDRYEVPAETVRSVLRKLRDLDLRSGWLAITRSKRLKIDGCLSLDGPVEDGLLYRLVAEDGPGSVLRIQLAGDELLLALADLDGRDRGAPLRVSMRPAADGRAVIPECLARLDPASTDPREVERFLRRIVRGVHAVDRDSA